VRPLGALALLRVLDFALSADETTLFIAPAVPAQPARQAAFKEALAALQLALTILSALISAR
jgi:hypothetical protein